MTPTQTDERKPYVFRAPRAVSPCGLKKSQKPCKKNIEGKCTEPSCDYGTLPYVKITSLNPDADMVTFVMSDTLRPADSPGKSQRQVLEKHRWPY